MGGQTNRVKMKLPIKKVYFDQIKEGKKVIEYRDAHITFVCEETGEILRREVTGSTVLERSPEWFDDVLEDKNMICFELSEK